MAGPELLHSDVSHAMDMLRNSGHVPRVDSVAALLEGRGSRPLIIRLMAEVIAAEAALREIEVEMPTPKVQMRLVTDNRTDTAGDSPLHGDPMENSLDALVADSEAMLGCSKSVFDKIERLEAEKSDLIAEVKKCQVQIARLQSPAPEAKSGRADHLPIKEVFGL